MSGPPKVRSRNVPSSLTISKNSRKVEAIDEEKIKKDPNLAADLRGKNGNLSAAFVFRRQEWLLHLNLSLNASCSSDASTDSFLSRASTGRIGRVGFSGRRRPSISKPEKKIVSNRESMSSTEHGDGKRRCSWVTPNTDPCYAAFHDEEWGVPVHDDKKLFELLVFSGALAELSWPAILSKRHIFREVFMDFDPELVSKLNEQKIVAPESTASSLLSELKLRALIENARQMLKIIEEFGSFDRYCWSFVNQKPITSRFRYSRQVSVKTPKADSISKDLMRRGFRSVGATVVYSFMQAAGLTNDHLISCYRFQECVNAESMGEAEKPKPVDGNKKEGEATGDEDLGVIHMELARAVNELRILARK